MLTMAINASAFGQIRVVSYNSAQFHGDANAMAEKIIELISGELSHLQIIDNARVKVSKYDKQNIIPNWYSIIDKYLNQKNAFWIYL